MKNSDYNYFNSNIYQKLFFIFAVSGILGNLYDRILFGYVRDYLGVGRFFIANFADILITLSIIFYLYFEIFVKDKNNKIDIK